MMNDEQIRNSFSFIIHHSAFIVPKREVRYGEETDTGLEADHLSVFAARFTEGVDGHLQMASAEQELLCAVPKGQAGGR
jgi:hypothetical protein